MTAYYTGMIYLTCFAMGIMALIVHSSDWLDREKQRQFQVIFATVAAAAGAEWLTVFLDGAAARGCAGCTWGEGAGADHRPLCGGGGFSGRWTRRKGPGS